MEEDRVVSQLRALNESELFYWNYRLAKFSPCGFEEGLDAVQRRHLL